MATSFFKPILACFITLALAIFISCEKKSTQVDTQGPEIVVYAPTSGSQYNFLDTVAFSADIYDESELQTIAVLLINGTDTIQLWPVGTIILGNITQYSLDEEVVNNVGVADTTNATLRFEATDKHDNYSKSDVAVQLI